MQDHRETTNTPQTPSKAKPLLQRFLSSPVIVGSPLSSPTTTASRAPTVNYQERMNYQKQVSYQSISSSSSASSLSSTSSASLYPRPPRYSPAPAPMTTAQATSSRSEALLRSTLLRDERSSSPQPQASSSRIPIPSSSTTPASRPGHRRRHSYAVTPQSTRFMVGPASRQGLDSVSGLGAAVGDGDGGREASEASLYMRANLIRRRSTNTGTPSDYTSDRSSTPRPQAMPHAPSSTTQNVYGGDAEVDLLSAAPQSSPFTSRTTKRQSASHITTTIITTSSSKRNSPTSCSPSPTKSTHKRATSPSPASKTGSIISSPRIQPSTVAQTTPQKKRQSLPASLHSLPPPLPSAIPPLPNMHQLPVPPPTAFNATFPEPQPQQLTTQEIELRARLERVLQADKKAAKKAAKEAARRATSKSRSPMKGQRRLMSEEAGNSLRFINGDVYLTDDESDEEAQEESGIHPKVGGDESLEPSTMLGVGARERKVSMNEVRDEEGSCPWRNDTSTSTSSSSSSLPATAITPGIAPASVMSSPKIDYTAHMKSRTEGAPWTPRHQPPALPSSSPVVYAVDEAHAGKRPPPSPLVNPRTPRTQPPHVLPSPEAVGYMMTRAGSMSTKRRHTATFNPPAAPPTTSPRTRSASLVPSPPHQTIPLAYAGQRNPNTMPSFLPSQEEGVKQGMITPPPTPPHTMRSASRSAAAQQRAESLARNSPLVYGNSTYTRSPHVRNATSRRPDTGRSGSGSSSSSSEFDEGCLDEGYIPPLSLHENHDVDIVSSPDASADPSRPSYFVDQGISHSRRPPPLTNSALFSGVSEEDAASMASNHARHMTFSAPSHRPTFNARKASERLKSTEGYISFASVEGLGCPPEYLHGDDDDKKEDERGRKGWKGLPGLGWVFGGGASAAEV